MNLHDHKLIPLNMNEVRLEYHVINKTKPWWSFIVPFTYITQLSWELAATTVALRSELVRQLKAKEVNELSVSPQKVG